MAPASQTIAESRSITPYFVGLVVVIFIQAAAAGTIHSGFIHVLLCEALWLGILVARGTKAEWIGAVVIHQLAIAAILRTQAMAFLLPSAALVGMSFLTAGRFTIKPNILVPLYALLWWLVYTSFSLVLQVSLPLARIPTYSIFQAVLILAGATVVAHWFAFTDRRRDLRA